MKPTTLLPQDALVIIDLQHDFLPGGALAVAGSDALIPVCNDYVARFARRRLPVYATRDWHPANHGSFRVNGGPWPVHCVQGTPGAEFPSALRLPADVRLVSKGTAPDDLSYSEFEHTDFAAQLHRDGVTRLFIGGLATDYCVRHTVGDARRAGFEVCLLMDAIGAVNLRPEDGPEAVAEMLRLGALPVTLADLAPANPGTSALLTDFYQLTMLRGYMAAGMSEPAVFEFFVRRLPPDWNFLIAAGLEQVLDYLEDFRFTAEDLTWLETKGGCDRALVRGLAGLRFTGEVHAMPEGTICFPDEPILRVTAPILEAQIVETRLVNLLHFQTLIASKAARCVLAAPAQRLVDFGLRRAHGAEAGLLAARACHLAGFASTSNVLAGVRYGLPVSGTMAHSFVEACDSEAEAFLRFARANPRHVVLVLDTYDTEAAAETVVRLAPTLQAEGIAVHGVRLDSGDLATHARRVRRILDAGGLRDTTIWVSGNLDEHALQRLVAAGAPFDGAGVGSRVLTSADAPYLDCAYKLQAYAGRPRCKLSEGKATWPGTKQVFRHLDAAGSPGFDIIALAEETHRGEPLLRPVMQHGRRLEPPPSLSLLRQRTTRELALLPPALRGLDAGPSHRVVYSEPLRALATRLGMLTGVATTGPRPPESYGRRHGLLGRIHLDGLVPVRPGTEDDADSELQSADRR